MLDSTRSIGSSPRIDARSTLKKIFWWIPYFFPSVTRTVNSSLRARYNEIALLMKIEKAVAGDDQVLDEHGKASPKAVDDSGHKRVSFYDTRTHAIVSHLPGAGGSGVQFSSALSEDEKSRYHRSGVYKVINRLKMLTAAVTPHAFEHLGSEGSPTPKNMHNSTQNGRMGAGYAVEGLSKIASSRSNSEVVEDVESPIPAGNGTSTSMYFPENNILENTPENGTRNESEFPVPKSRHQILPPLALDIKHASTVSTVRLPPSLEMTEIDASSSLKDKNIGIYNEEKDSQTPEPIAKYRRSTDVKNSVIDVVEQVTSRIEAHPVIEGLRRRRSTIIDRAETRWDRMCRRESVDKEKARESILEKLPWWADTEEHEHAKRVRNLVLVQEGARLEDYDPLSSLRLNSLRETVTWANTVVRLLGNKSMATRMATCNDYGMVDLLLNQKASRLAALYIAMYFSEAFMREQVVGDVVRKTIEATSGPIRVHENENSDNNTSEYNNSDSDTDQRKHTVENITPRIPKSPSPRVLKSPRSVTEGVEKLDPHSDWLEELLVIFSDGEKLDNFLNLVTHRDFANSASALHSLARDDHIGFGHARGGDMDEFRKVMLSMSCFLMKRDCLKSMAATNYNTYTAAVIHVSYYWNKVAMVSVIQMMMYYGAVQFNEKGDLPSGKLMGNVLCVCILLFVFVYTVDMGLREFHSNTFMVFKECGNVKRVFIGLNILVNCLLSSLLPVMTQRVLDSCSSFLDVILNSVAMLFVAELDDVLLSDFDIENLNKQRIQRLITSMKLYGERDSMTIPFYAPLEILVVWFLVIIYTIGWALATIKYTHIFP